MKNRFGINRTIPVKVKEQVRKNSGFGCVICGLGIYEYEHIHPEFKDCKEHIAEGITLLCPNHHASKTRGFLSSETIKEAMSNPASLQKKYSNYSIDTGRNNLTVKIANCVFINVPNLIVIKNQNIFSMYNPLSPKELFSISAQFYNSRGEKSLKIDKNEWFAYSSNWDVNYSGGRLIIKDSKKEYSLIMKLVDRENIEIEVIKLRFREWFLDGNKNQLIFYNSGNKVLEIGSGLSPNSTIRDSAVGFFIQ